MKWLSDHALGGAHPLSSAQDLATEYLRDQSYQLNAIASTRSARRGFKTPPPGRWLQDRPAGAGT